MMMKLRLLPYKLGSRSARLIARALNGLRVRAEGRYRPRRRHLVVNWGSATIPRWWDHVYHSLNSPRSVANASNKAIALNVMKQAGVQTVEFTADIEVAHEWIRKGKVVVGRAILNGHGGIGCRVYSKNLENILAPLPLYTKHLRHKREFRVHVFDGQIIDQVEKLKRNVYESERSYWIRNLETGWVFCRNGITVPECVRVEAFKAIKALELDFGAVDIGYREKEDRAFVFEVNTAPGIEGTTIMSYVKAIRNSMRNLV